MNSGPNNRISGQQQAIQTVGNSPVDPVDVEKMLKLVNAALGGSEKIRQFRLNEALKRRRDDDDDYDRKRRLISSEFKERFTREKMGRNLLTRMTDCLEWDGQLFLRDSHIGNVQFARFFMYSIVHDNAAALYILPGGPAFGKGLNFEERRMLKDQQMLQGVETAKMEDCRSLLETIIATNAVERQMSICIQRYYSDWQVADLWGFLCEKARLEDVACVPGKWLNRRFCTVALDMTNEYQDDALSALSKLKPQDFSTLREFAVTYAWLWIYSKSDTTRAGLKPFFKLIDEFLGHENAWGSMRLTSLPDREWLGRWNLLVREDWSAAVRHNSHDDQGFRPAPGACFVCDGFGHQARKCPERKQTAGRS
ncbi:hypothetical protein CJU90_0998 [Yarrowia sp. C11]|nr:hypothetical protein CJU90_0998 [Yarrowia sp. C11]